jgi:hypothetical protein
MLFSNTLSLCSFLNAKNQFQIHTQQQTELSPSAFYSFGFMQQTERKKILGQMVASIPEI